MTTDYIAKLTYKTHELDLNAGNYRLAPDFVPPPINEAVQISEGTVANRYDGGQVVSKKNENRRWAFGVHISGSSDAEIARSAGNLQWFLQRAGDPSSPVCFEYRANSDVGFEPLWGQYGANLRYEIITGKLSLSSQYGIATLRGMGLPNCRVELMIKPFALGLQQRLMSAKGGILEDTWGSSDGLSQGTIIGEDITSKMTNSVFGHSTYDNGWTTAANLVSSEVTDQALVTFGKSAAKLTAQAATSNTFTQSIVAGNTNTHTLSCYVRRVDGGAVTSDDILLFYSTSQAGTTFQSLGNGLYRAVVSVTGIAIGTATGVLVKDHRTVIVDGFDFIELGYELPPVHGDMLGCSWSGTAHASSSVRAVGELKIDAADILDIGEGTIRMILKTVYPSTCAQDLYLFSNGASSFAAYYSQSDDKFYFTDGTNTISSASAESFSFGDKLILHFVWEPGSLKIYLDGTETATGSTYDPPTLATDLYIGSDHSNANHLNSTIMEMATCDQAMTATEVNDDYVNILEQVEDNRRLSPIPYLWTKDGDDVVDNCDDSTRDNYCVIGGIPGSDLAKAEYRMQSGVTTQLSGFWLALSRMPYRKFIYPTSQWYSEAQGTSLASCSGGEYDQDTITSATVVNTLTLDWPEEFRGQIHFFGRLAAAATDNAKITPLFYFGSGGVAIAGEEKTLSLTTDFKWYYLGAMNIEYPGFLTDDSKAGVWGIRVDDVDGSVDFRNDFLMAISGDILFSSGVLLAGSTILITSKEITYRATTADKLMTFYPTKGNRIELEPEKYNFLWVFLAKDVEAHDITDTMTFRSIKITPRWTLL